MKILIICLCLFFVSIAIAQQDISFKILDQTVSDKCLIKLQISNNSRRAFFLPFDFTCNSLNKDFFSPNPFFIDFAVINIKTKKRSRVELKCETDDCLKLSHKYYTAVRKKSVNDMFLMRPNESKIVNVYFQLQNKKNDYFYAEYENFLNYKNGEYSVKVIFMNNYDYCNCELPRSVIVTLRRQGYHLYRKPITSNKVPLIIKN